MSIIKAPYNFVPVSKQVVKPYWTKHVSHDIPFADTQSGTIEVTMTAESPIFVKNGLKKSEEEQFFNMNDGKKEGQKKPFDFNRDERGYFIPGSSLRGMIRSVMEVMSFGRMENKVNDHKYALRDLSGAMKKHYRDNLKPDKIFAGWLSKDLLTNTYRINEYDIPGRISHRQLDSDFGLKMTKHFEKGGDFEKSCKTDKKDVDYYKSAQYKYDEYGKKIDGYHAFIKSHIQDTSAANDLNCLKMLQYQNQTLVRDKSYLRDNQEVEMNRLVKNMSVMSVAVII